MVCTANVWAQGVVAPAFISERVANDSDDPAIWLNKNNPSESLILGTDKEEDGALYVFNMQGKIIADKTVRNLRRPNNVDIAYGMALQGRKVDIAVVTERLGNRLRIFSVPDMQPIDNGGIAVFEGETSTDYRAPMGIALYQPVGSNRLYAIVSRKAGPTNGTYLWQYLLEDDGRGNVKATVVRKFGKYSGRQEIESIAVDAELGYIYYSDEKEGVRKYYADPEKGNEELALFGTTGFREDHEGISIYKIADGTGYILVSDQGANRFQVFPREGSGGNPHSHPVVKVVPVQARESDGSELLNYPILPHFPNGVFVAMSTDRTFHLYRWEDIAGNDLKVEPPNTNINAPQLSAPANGSTSLPIAPLLNWQTVQGADAYQVQVSSRADFSTTVLNQSVRSANSLQLSNLAYSSVFYWRVRAVQAAQNSAWSSVWSFTTIAPPRPELTTPILLSPANLAAEVSVTPTFSWRAAAGADTYQLQIASDDNFQDVEFEEDEIATTTLQASSLAYSTTYFWRVRVMNSTDSSSWSSVRRFTTIAATLVPALASPADGATRVPVTPVLTWYSLENEATYQVQVSGRFDFSATVYDQAALTDTAVQISELEPSTAYFWRVRAQTATQTSDWSGVWSFTTLPVSSVELPPPALVAPADLAGNVPVSPTFSWRSTAGADAYQLQLALDEEFENVAFEESNLTVTSTQTTSLQIETTYFWRVRAMNSTDSSSWSAIRSFTTTAGILAGTLAGYWELDEGSGRLLLDASGNGNNATSTGNPAWEEGISGLALRLYRSNQHVRAPHAPSLNITETITLAAWVKPEERTTQYIIKKAVNGEKDGYELSLASNGKVFFRFNQASAKDKYRVNSSTSYPRNGRTWMHIAATYDGRVARIYINGIENSAKEFSNPPAIATNTLPLGIGAESDGSKNLKGTLDEVRVYNIALSASEILALTKLPVPGPSATDTTTEDLVDVPDLEQETLRQPELAQHLLLYPNPFYSTATIQFVLRDGGAYSITLYDSKGAQVNKVLQGTAEAGKQHTAEVSGEGLSNGLYIVRLQSAQGTKSVRLMLNR
ncbi:phytase [Pontibacter qinzhouensis]|uniref:phytase n=1 Tax=Pontibacter qinzhouensis TaxID=2603253 RepID=UPI0034E2FE86